MNAYLIDTHTLLWFLEGNSRLSETSKAVIQYPGNQIFTSVVCLWEITIKVSQGKLHLPEPIDSVLAKMQELNIGILPLQTAHVLRASTLPLYHHDPFDRIIIAQALTEGMPVVSKDAIFEEYGLEWIW
jgi:PIN domain nuclease of toxin-antitoxin system